jgi:Family of unknown function (DUF6370)
MLLRQMTLIRVVLAVALFCALAPPAHANEKTHEGTLVCAKCFLKKPDAKECQDVLLVPEKGKKTEYYIQKNEVAEKAGEACTTQVKAKVTGTLSQKDGKTWLTPSKIEKQ